MHAELKVLLSKHEDIDADKLKAAAAELLSCQFLYRVKNRQRKHFEIVTRFQSYFYNLMDAVGHQLLVEETHGFVGIIPNDYNRKMSLDETLLLFTLRFLYDEEISAFKGNEDGSVDISMEDFEVRYTRFTQRELPQQKGEFKQLMSHFARHGIAEYGAYENTPEIGRVRILPSITVLLTGDVTKRIEAYMRASDIDTQTEEDEV